MNNPSDVHSTVPAEQKDTLVARIDELYAKATPGEWVSGPGNANDYLVGTPRTNDSVLWQTASLLHYRFERLIAIAHNVPPSVNGLCNARLIAALHNAWPVIRTDRHELLCALTDALEYLEEREDTVDGSDGPQPNRAMHLASVLREVLAKTGAT